MCQSCLSVCLSVFPPQQKTKIEMTMMEMTYGSKPSTPVKKYATPSHLYCFTVPSNSHVKCKF